MGGPSMVRLAEIDRCKFPIGIEPDFSRKNPDCGIHRVILINLGQRMKIIHQPRTIVTKAIPDKTAPSITAEFFESQLAAGITLGKILGVMHRLQHAI